MKIEIELEYPWKYNQEKYAPYNWMANDIYRAVQTQSNYLIGLGLVCYSEAVGRWIREELDHIKPYSSDGFECWSRFVKDFMGIQLSDPRKMYQQVRHGLAHAYFMKTTGGVYNPGGPIPIVIASDGTLSFSVGSYFQAFIKGLETWIDLLEARRI